VNGVVAVGAHPDDLEIFCGGTLARYARRGVPVVGVIAARGEKGTRQPGADPERLAVVRRAEAEASARLLGLRDLVFLGFPDGELDRVVGALRERLTAVYRRYRPRAVFAFDPWRPYELHPDHRAAGLAAVDARLAAKLPLYYPEQAALGLQPWDVGELYLYNPAQPDTWFAVDETFACKLEALGAHRSQFDDRERQEMAEALRAEARRNGPRAGAEYAEGFKRFRFDGLQILQNFTRQDREG
jgi:LmbE family N-acetylglucosaminyl deacetylase